MIIGITGTYGAGKDVIAEYLIGKGYNHYSLSNELREVLAERGIEESRDALIAMGNELREKHGHGHLAERVIKKAKKPAVVTSIRHPLEVETLRQESEFILLHVDADQKTRFERTTGRSRVGDITTFEEFVGKERKELAGAAHEQNLTECFKKADHVVYNDGTLMDLYQEIDIIVERYKK